jgi:HAMP domain-containing protein
VIRFSSRFLPEAPGARRARGGLARSVLLLLLPLALGPLIIVAILLYTQAQADVTEQVTRQLTALSTLKEFQIDEWAAHRVADLHNLATSPDILERSQQVMWTGEAEAARAALRERLERFARNNSDYKALLMVNAENGEVIEASETGQPMLGEFLQSEAFFEEARFTPRLFPPRYDARMNPEAVSIIAAAPVIDPRQGTLAILVGIIRDAPLLNIIAPSPGLGATGRAYALTADGYPLGSVITPGFVKPTSDGIARALGQKVDGSGRYPGPPTSMGERLEVIGAYNWLAAYEIGLIVEQNTGEAYAPLNRTTTVLAAVTVLAVVISVAATLFFTRRLTAPIQELTDRALRMAGGDLRTRVYVGRADEIGLLADAFNRMGDQLQESYRGLEAKVEARTRQLAAAAEVSRAATSILNTDALLARVTELIHERFGYSHVSVFLLDEAGENAVLREATGPIGQQLKAQGFQLAVGSQSIIGWVSANRAPRIVDEVADDPVYLQTETLTDTRSEAALPIRIGDRLLGVLDVQSRAPGAFSPADVEALQIVADQIAVSIENGRLFARQQRVLQLEDLVISLTGKIHQTFKLDTILENAATELGRAFGARRAVVRLRPPEAETPNPE